MDMNTIGLVGNLLLTFCGVPELFRTLKDKKCHLGWGFLLMWFFGEVFCLFYGFHLNQIPLIINYVFNFTLVFVMVYYKVFDYFKTKKLSNSSLCQMK